MKRFAIVAVLVVVAGLAAAFPSRLITAYNQTLWKDTQTFEKAVVLQGGVEGALVVDGGLHVTGTSTVFAWATVDAGTGTSTVNVAITSGTLCTCSSSTGVVAVRCTPDGGTLTVRSAADTTGVAICL